MTNDMTDNTVNDDQNQQVQAPVGGGVSPETGPVAPTQGEAQPKAESGYEQIKKIEQEAERADQMEKKPRRMKPSKQKPESQSQTGEKKETPQAIQPKYFGYKPPKDLISNPQKVKRQAGTGNKQDAKTWLLVFLDRVLKKESI